MDRNGWRIAEAHDWKHIVKKTEFYGKFLRIAKTRQMARYALEHAFP